MGAWGKRYTSSHSSFQVLKDWTIWCFSYFAFHSISGAGSQSRENKNEEFNEEGKKNDTSCNKGRASLESFSVLLPGCYDVCLNFEKRDSSLAKRRTALQKVRSRPQTGPTLMVLKWRRRMCCLCHDIHTWLDVLVFSDKDDQVSATFPASFLNYSARDVKESTHTSRKEKGTSQPCTLTSQVPI